MKFNKSPLTFQQQIDLLKTRGLRIENERNALKKLQNINFYRISAYFPPFQTEKDVFDEGTCFSDILYLYEFDRNLQNLILEAAAGVEISVRTQLAYHLAHKYGPFGYIEPDNFNIRFNHFKWMEGVKANIKKSREDFVRKFKNKYDSEDYLPVWMVCEVVSFGQVSILFKGLRKHDKKVIANRHYGADPFIMESWLHSLVYVRNLCAHHSRIWNRKLQIQPKIDGRDRDWNEINDRTVFSTFLSLKKLTQLEDNWNQWAERLDLLLSQFDTIDISEMGFPADWKELLFI